MIKLTIRNDESDPATTKRAIVQVTTVSDDDVKDVVHELAAGQAVTVDVGAGQFIQVEGQQE